MSVTLVDEAMRQLEAFQKDLLEHADHLTQVANNLNPTLMQLRRYKERIFSDTEIRETLYLALSVITSVEVRLSVVTIQASGVLHALDDQLLPEEHQAARRAFQEQAISSPRPQPVDVRKRGTRTNPRKPRIRGGQLGVSPSVKRFLLKILEKKATLGSETHPIFKQQLLTGVDRLIALREGSLDRETISGGLRELYEELRLNTDDGWMRFHTEMTRVGLLSSNKDSVKG